MRVPRGHAGCVARGQTGRVRDRHGFIVRFVLLGAREERLASAGLARVLVGGGEHGGGWASVSAPVRAPCRLSCVASRSFTPRTSLSSLALVTAVLLPAAASSESAAEMLPVLAKADSRMRLQRCETPLAARPLGRSQGLGEFSGRQYWMVIGVCTRKHALPLGAVFLPVRAVLPRSSNSGCRRGRVCRRRAQRSSDSRCFTVAEGSAGQKVAARWRSETCQPC